MARFHGLTVTDVRKTTRDAVIVTLAPDNPEDFSFVQGQYLTFRRVIDGEEVRRSYSICTGLDDGNLQVAIKRVEGGRFSGWANETLAKGDRLEAMAPMGAFHAPIDPMASRHYLCFAGGSGITPVLSIIRTVLVREPRSRITLVYANRGVNTIMFREEIEDLKNLYIGRFNIIHVLETDAQEIDLFTGRVDAEKCASLFERWIDIASVDMSFICGPEPMMLAIAKSLRDHGLADNQIKFELFATPGTKVRRDASCASLAKGTGGAVSVSVTLDGATRSFEARRDQAVLDAALDNDLDVPFACKAGVCSTCRCKLLAGEVEMAANHALEDYEVRQGYILSCQSYPLTDSVTIDYDQ